MPDNEPTKNSRDGGPDAVDGGDVDSLLDEASELVADLSGQLGSDRSDPPSSPSERPDGPDETPGESALDAQLDALEGLLDQTEAEIGTVSQPKDGIAAEDGTATADSTSTDAKPIPAPEPKSEAPDPGVTKPKRVSDESADVPRDPSPTQGSPSDAASAPARKSESLQRPSGGSASSRGGTPTPSDPPSAMTANAPAGLCAVVVRIEDMLCAALDWIDRPFARVSYRVRQVLGLCAIATLLVAVATIVYSRMY